MIYKHFLNCGRGGGQNAVTYAEVDPAYQSGHREAMPAMAPAQGRLGRRIPPAGHPCRYVFVQRARCPQCGQPAIRKYRTNPPETDGSRTSYAMCIREGCGWTGFLIEE